MRRIVWSIVLLVVATPSLPALATGTTDGLVYTQKGTLPIILTAPHGGKEKVPGVELRTGGGAKNFKVVLDTRTHELATAIAADLEAMLGGSVYVVAAEFSRKYIDANRSFEEGAETPAAKPYYDRYHNAIRADVDEVRARFKRGLLVDVHGQGQTDHLDQVMRGTRNGATCKQLIATFGDKAVVGPTGLFGLLEHNGLKVFPANQSPLIREDALNGGYTVATYGSSTDSGIDAFQMEFGTNLRAAASIKSTANATAKSIAAFYRAYIAPRK